jgi:single-stranded DNA-binding protein
MLAKATLLGRVGKKHHGFAKSGDKVTCLTVVTNKRYTNSKGEVKLITTWHLVNFFSKFGTVVDENTEVGDIVYIEGDIVNVKATVGDKKGQWLYSVTGNEIQFISRINNDSFREEPPADFIA